MSGPSGHVLVVGAGMAGLSAAQHLWQHGVTGLTVLEASDRLGGRIHTQQFGKEWRSLVELGGNWIHGASARNSLFTLAQSQGLLSQPSVFLDRMEGFCYRSDGGVISRELAQRVHSMYLTWEEKEGVRAGPVTDPASRISQHQYLLRCLAEDINKFAEDEHEDVKCVFNCLLNLDRFLNGGYIEDIAVPDIGGFVSFHGGDMKVPAGMSSIVYKLADQLPAGVVQLSRTVEHIEINPQSRQCEVTCVGGYKYTADHVLVTVSLGYLKANHHTIFQPSLPPAKVKAIKDIGYGKVNKMFLYWDQPFWCPGSGGIKLCWTDRDAEMTSVAQWYKQIFALDEVLDNPHVLVGWISGDAAEHMETLSDSEVISTVTALIRHFLRDPSVAAPCRVLRSRWCMNAYIKGAYSYWTAHTTDKVLQDLMEPVIQEGVPRVLFAGEATDCANYSTMHGARNSGLREAGRLLAYLGKKVSKL